MNRNELETFSFENGTHTLVAQERRKRDIRSEIITNES